LSAALRVKGEALLAVHPANLHMVFVSFRYGWCDLSGILDKGY
jgi:hypothetical protein